jgi:hypothetical protein
MGPTEDTTTTAELPARTTTRGAPARSAATCATCGRAAGDPCAWCKVGKPAALGAAAGGAASLIVPGLDMGRGLLWGSLGGALLGWLRSR